MSKELPTLRERWNQLSKDYLSCNLNPKNGQLDHIQRYDFYINFTAQLLALWMFVPCDKEGKPMEPLQMCCDGKDCGCMGMPVNVSSQKEIDEYYEALDRCLFVGWEIDKDRRLSNNDVKVGFYRHDEFHFIGNTIEDIIKLGIEPTTRVAKELKL